MKRPSRPSFDFSSGALCLDFINTVGDHTRGTKERLREHRDLVAWGRQASLLSEGQARSLRAAARARPRAARAVVGRARQLRERLYRIFSASSAGRAVPSPELARFNRELAEALSHLQVASGKNGFAWRWSPAEVHPERLFWPVLRSAADLLTSERIRRVRECDSTTCTWLFVDHSPNGRRRWCDMKSCGNREKARRHYARRKVARSKGRF